MSVARVLDRLAARGISVTADGDELVIQGDLSAEQIQWLKKHKHQLLLHLRAPPEIRPRLERVLQRLVADAMHEYREDFEPLVSFTDAELQWVVLDLFARRYLREVTATNEVPA